VGDEKEEEEKEEKEEGEGEGMEDGGDEEPPPFGKHGREIYAQSEAHQKKFVSTPTAQRTVGAGDKRATHARKGEMTAWAVGDKEQLATYAVELRHLIRTPGAPREGESAEFVADEPPPTQGEARHHGRWKNGIPGANTDHGRDGIWYQSAGSAGGTCARHPQSQSGGGRNERTGGAKGGGAGGPVGGVVEAEETYLKEFDRDKSHQDTAMREAGGDWLQMDADKRQKLDKTKYVVDTAYGYVKMKQASYVRARRSEALQSVRDYKKEKARREKRDMPRTPPPPEEEEESEPLKPIQDVILKKMRFYFGMTD
jgi:hypothetical protein